LLDLGAGLGESSVVGAVEDELTLDVSGESDLGVGEASDDLVLLATKEVLDSDGGAILGDNNIDGEMSVNQSHLVSETLGGTSDHVLDEGLEGVDSTGLLVSTEPDSDADEGTVSLLGVLLHLLELAGDVREVFLDFTSLALDGNLSGVNSAGNIIWDLYPVFLQHLSHFALVFFIK